MLVGHLFDCADLGWAGVVLSISPSAAERASMRPGAVMWQTKMPFSSFKGEPLPTRTHTHVSRQNQPSGSHDLAEWGASRGATDMLAGFSGMLADQALQRACVCRQIVSTPGGICWVASIWPVPGGCF